MVTVSPVSASSGATTLYYSHQKMGREGRGREVAQADTVQGAKVGEVLQVCLVVLEASGGGRQPRVPGIPGP